MEFKSNEAVLCKAEGDKRVKWMKAVVVSKGSERTYKIKMECGRIRLCHGDQLRKFYNKEKDIVIPPQIGSNTCTSWNELPFHSPSLESPIPLPQTPTNNTPNSDEDEFHTPPASTRKLRPKGNVQYYETRPRKITRKKKKQRNVPILSRSLNLTLS